MRFREKVRCSSLMCVCVQRRCRMTSPEKEGGKKSARKKVCMPKNWRAEVGGVKQPCWCGEEWKDYHEDGRHGPIMQ